MSKRYVYWKTPEGKPYKGSDGKHAPKELLAHIGKTSSINKEGQVQWNNIRVTQFDSVIRSALVVIGPDGDELNSNDKWSIVRPIISSIIKKKGGEHPISPSELISEADMKAAEHYRSKINDYILVTSLSIKSFPGDSLTIHGCKVMPLKTRDARYPLPNAIKYQIGETRIGKHIESTRYLHVRVKTSGRTIHESTSKAFEALTLLRGFWNLFATHGSWSMSFGSPQQKALGAIHVGPIYTLHHPDGTLVEDIYWYEPAFVEDQELFEPREGWNRIEKNRRWSMNRMKYQPYRSDLQDLITRYAKALDQADLDLAFLQMWSILEKITDTIGKTYDETVERAVWVFKDRLLAKEMLQILRLHRNQFVHAAKTGGNDRDQIAYMIKQFIEPHLFRLIRNDFKVGSLEEYGNYLAMPASMGTLEKRQQQLRQAIRMFKNWAKP